MKIKQEELAIANEVIRRVNLYFDTDCQLKTRKRSVSQPRMMACYIIHKLAPRLTLEAIGNLFDVTHATVIHAINKTYDSITYYKTDMDAYVSIKASVEISDDLNNSDAFKKGDREEIAMSLYKLVLNKPLSELKELLTK
jgi:predicted DNA-binding protein YlxM (UPF0122 family)